MDNDSRRLVQENLLESIFKSFLDKGWDSRAGIVCVSEVEMVGVRDHDVERVLHVGQGLFHIFECFFLLGEKVVAAVGRVKHTEVGVVCEVEEVLLVV